MGLFDIFKKNEQPKKNPESKMLLAMPMFVNGDKYELDAIVDTLKNYWELPVTEVEGDNVSAVLVIDGEKVAIAFVPAPIPMGDIEGTAKYAYNWTTILDDIKNFTGHAIVSVLPGTKPAKDRFALLSKVLHAILTTSNAIGVYKGSQSLLIPKDEYIENAEILRDDETPITLWVYIGMRNSDKGNSIYTYGLYAFGKYEMEVIDSKLPLEELYNFMANICIYVVENNVTFKNGETLGYTADQKVKITLSEGRFVEGQSLKLDM